MDFGRFVGLHPWHKALTRLGARPRMKHEISYDKAKQLHFAGDGYEIDKLMASDLRCMPVVSKMVVCEKGF